MRFWLFSTGALALPGVVSAGGQCVCREVVVWETETVWVTVAPGYQKPSSCPLAIAYPTSCTECGYTLVGTLPQYIQTEICTTVTFNDGKALPTTWTTGSTCWVNTICTVDKDGETHGLDPITKTVTPSLFPTPTLLPAGYEYETCVIPPWVIDAGGQEETIPACTVTWTWFPGPSYYPEPYEYTTTKWNQGTPVISIVNSISINVVTPNGSVWVGGDGQGGQPRPTKSRYPINNGYPPVGSPPSGAGGSPRGGSAPAPVGGGNGISGDNAFTLLSSDGNVVIVEDGTLVFVPPNSAAALNSNGMFLINSSLTDGGGNVAIVDGIKVNVGKSDVTFQRKGRLSRRAGNGTTNANGTLSWDFNSVGDLEGWYGGDPLYFFNCLSLFELSLNDLPGICISVTLTAQPVSSHSPPSDNSSTSAVESVTGTTGTTGTTSEPATAGSSAARATTTPTTDRAASTTVSSTSTSSTSSTTSGSVVSGTPTNFAAQMVLWHNIYRARHGSPPVTWNDTLAAYALNYSQHCSTDHSDSLYYGENLAYGGYTNPAYYVYLWYNEIENYNFSNPGFSLTTGHFTQVVWEASLQIGCGWVYNHCNPQLGNSYPNYLTCEYYPYGNVDGEFAVEVSPVILGAGAILVPPGDLI